MTSFQFVEAAHRAGVGEEELRRLVELGVVSPSVDGRFTGGDLRRVALVQSLVAAGIPLDGLATAVRGGQVSLAFLDAPAFERFSALSDLTFAQLAEGSDVPLELLMFIREAAGWPAPRPDDRVRIEELPLADLIVTAIGAGFRATAIQQQVRAQSDSLRRVAETESAIWQSEVIEPATRAGKRPDEILGDDIGDRMSVLSEQAVLSMYHLQQGRAWTAGIIGGLEMQLEAAGLHSRLEHPPAMCFLDIAGYTRLTQERGDAAAAELAEQLGRIVQRLSVGHGGRPVKWLGDGVMLHYPRPADGVLAALEMVLEVVAAGLPPAHVGLHAGPVIFQEGDYYGQTVNIAARIAAYAQAGQVIVSQAIVDDCADASIEFRAIGPVELKGVSGAVPLYGAYRPA